MQPAAPLFSSLVTGRACRSSSAPRTDGPSEIARAAGLDQEKGGLDNLILDVILDPFLFGKELVANCLSFHSLVAHPLVERPPIVASIEHFQWHLAVSRCGETLSRLIFCGEHGPTSARPYALTYCFLPPTGY